MSESGRPAFSIREAPLWLLCALDAILFARPLFFGRTLSLRDLANWAFPQRRRLIELWRDSGVPLRDPFFHGGQPFLANLNNAALYPTGLLGFLFPSVLATNLEIALHVALCAAGAYALARVVGLGRPAAFVCGAAFAFAGPTLSLTSLFNRMLAMPHLVLFLLFWHLFLRDGRRAFFAAAAVAGALMVFAGSVETLLLAGALALLWPLFADLPRGGGAAVPKRLLAFAALAAAVFALAAVQILPARRLVARSSRVGMRYAAAADWSLNPRRLPEIAFPELLGRADSIDERDYWGSHIEDSGYPLLPSIYLGAPVLVLAAAGLSRRGGRLSMRFRLFLAAAAIAAVAAALGRFFPVFPALYALLPPLRIFRFPVKFLLAATLPVALLAGCGAEQLLEQPPDGERSSRRPPLPLVAASLLFAGAAAVALSESARRALLPLLFLQPLGAPAESDVVRSIVRTALACAALLGVWALGRRRPVLAAWFAGALVAADLLSAGRSLLPTAPRAWMEKAPPFAQEVRARIGDGRFAPVHLPKRVTLSAETKDEFWHADWQRQVLGDFTGPGFDVPVIFHRDFDGLAPARLAVADNFLASLPWERRIPLLSAASVRVFVSHAPLNVPDIQPLGEVPNRSDLVFYAWANSRSAPREALVHAWSAVDSAARSAAAVTDPGFDPRRAAVLEAKGAVPAPPASCGETPGSLRIAARSPKRTAVDVTAACAGLVVFSEPRDEAWEATVDGRRAPTVPANLLFFAVPVGPGPHRVEILYRPSAVALGAIVSALAAAALAAFIGLGMRRPATARTGSTL